MKKITSILLTLFFLLSSSHLSFAIHFCGGHATKHALLMDVNDFGCRMENEIAHQKTDACDVQNKCCDTQVIDLSIQDNFQLSVSKVVSEQYFILVSIVPVLFTIPLTEKHVDLYKNYQPPLPEKDLPVLFQTLLI